MALDGILLSLHALVDTHDAALWAWTRAFASEGFALPPDRLGSALLSEPEDLVFELLGAKVEATRGARLRASQRMAFISYLAEHGATPALGAVELLRELHRRGIETALVGAASEDEVTAVEAASGVAWRRELDVVALPADTTSHSLGCALSLLRMTPAQCAFLGRAPREARDAASHGIASAATTHGRIARSALRKAGARLVVQDLRALAGGLERLLRVLSPGSLRWDEAVLTRFMREALQMAEQNLAQCRAPHGAVVATGAGVLVGRGRDLSDTHGALAHAEMEAMRMAQAHLRPGEGAILATTAAPCAMCLSAAAECGIDMVLYGTRGEQRRPSHRIGAAQDRKAASPRILGGILAEQCASLLARFRAADESGSHIRRESGLLTRHAAVNPAQRATK